MPRMQALVDAKQIERPHRYRQARGDHRSRHTCNIGVLWNDVGDSDLP